MEEKEARLLGIEVGKKFAQPQYSITYSLSLDLDSGDETNQKTIVLPPGIPTRDIVIDAIITDAYPTDKMQAVQNNYLLDPNDEEAVEEMNVMQGCRRHAKMIADEFIEYINENIN